MSVSINPSFQSTLERVQEALAIGNMDEARDNLARAEDIAYNSEQELEVGIFAIRYHLLAGNYTLANKLIQRYTSKLSANPILIEQKKVVIALLGWESEEGSKTTVSFLTAISQFLDLGSTSVEKALLELSAWSDYILREPRFLHGLSDDILDLLGTAYLGSRYFPPIIEGVLAELWYHHRPETPYPLLSRLKQYSAFQEYNVVIKYIEFLDALHKNDIQTIRERVNFLFCPQGIWLWLRCLELVVYFGDVLQIEELPWRITRAKQLLHDKYRIELETHDYMHIVSDVIAVFKLAHISGEYLIDDGLHLLEQHLGKYRVQNFPKNFVPWQPPPSSCLLVQTYFSQVIAYYTGDASQVKIAFPFLERCLEFLSAQHHKDKANTFEIWRNLPTFLRCQPYFASIAISYLKKQKGQNKSVQCAQSLYESGVATFEISSILRPEHSLAWYEKYPSVGTSVVVAELDVARLRGKWLSLLRVSLIWIKNGLNTEESLALTNLLSHLNSELVRPTISEASSFPANQVNQVVASFVRLGEEKITSTVFSVLESFVEFATIGGHHKAIQPLVVLFKASRPREFANLTALLWLRTGLLEYLQPEAWEVHQTYQAQIALAYYNLYMLRDVAKVASNSSSLCLYPLTQCLEELTSWKLACQQQVRILPFNTDLLVDLSSEWKFLKPLASALIGEYVVCRDTNDCELFLILMLSQKFTKANVTLIIQSISRLSKKERDFVVGLVLLSAAEVDPAYCIELLKQYYSDVPWGVRWKILEITQKWDTTRQVECNQLLLSPEATRVAQLPRNVSEQTLRQNILKVKSLEVFEHPVFARVSTILQRQHFVPYHFEQWHLLSALRKRYNLLPKDTQDDLLLMLDEGSRDNFERVFRQPLRPIFLDLDNIILNDLVCQKYVERLEFMEHLWNRLWEEKYYPILTFADRNHWRIYEGATSDGSTFNNFVTKGYIHVCHGEGKRRTADFNILTWIDDNNWEDIARVVTNDYYAKEGEDGWNQEFSWLKQRFDAMSLYIDRGSSGAIILRSRLK